MCGRSTLADGQLLKRPDACAVYISAIAGRIIDPNGDPVDGAELRVLRLPKSGRGNPQMRAAGATNDIGEFRVAGLDAGSYVLVIVPRRDAGRLPPTHPVPTSIPA